MPKTKPRPAPWYQQLLDRQLPPRPLLANCARAFTLGGLLCAVSEAAYQLLMLQGLGETRSAAYVTCTVILITALLTGLGVYDRLGQRFGAGLAVPISGFANSLAAAMLEHKYEGLVLGSGCNSFKLAGAVVVFGVAAATAVSLIALIGGWV